MTAFANIDRQPGLFRIRGFRIRIVRNAIAVAAFRAGRGASKSLPQLDGSEASRYLTKAIQVLQSYT